MDSRLIFTLGGAPLLVELLVHPLLDLSLDPGDVRTVFGQQGKPVYPIAAAATAKGDGPSPLLSHTAEAVAAGTPLGPKVDWPWPKDYEGQRCASVELDATGVRQQGEDGGPAEGRMADVGMVCNPAPEFPWPDDVAFLR